MNTTKQTSRRYLMTAVAVIALISASFTPVMAQTKIAWKLNGDQQATFWWSQELDTLTKDITAASKGKFELTFYPASSLGIAPADVLAPLSAGKIEMAEFVASYVGAEAPYLAVLGLPMVTGSAADLKKKAQAIKPEMERKLAQDYDLKLLGTLISTPLQLFLGKKEYRGVASLKNMRIRTQGPDQELFVKSLGATAVQMPIGDLVTATATNRIDGSISGTQYYLSQQYQQFGANLVAWNALYGQGFLAVSKKKWNELDPELQQVIEKSAKAFEDRVWARSATLEAEVQQQAIAAGFKIIHPTESDMKAISDLATASWKSWADRNGPVAKHFLEVVLGTK